MIPGDTHSWLVKEILLQEGNLRVYVKKYFSEPADVEDVIQETYAHLLGLEPPARAAVRDWSRFLFVTARNIAIDRLRKRRVISLDAMVEIDNRNVIDERPTAYEELSARQELALLTEAIATLPDRCRRVLTLRKLFGLSQREIAEQLGISESTVEKHIANGIRLCALRLFSLRGSESGRAAQAAQSNTEGTTDGE